MKIFLKNKKMTDSSTDERHEDLTGMDRMNRIYGETANIQYPTLNVQPMKERLNAARKPNIRYQRLYVFK